MACIRFYSGFIQRDITPEREITRTRKKKKRSSNIFPRGIHIWNFQILACTVFDERTHALTDTRGCTDNPKPIYPVNFFEVGGIKTHLSLQRKNTSVVTRILVQYRRTLIFYFLSFKTRRINISQWKLAGRSLQFPGLHVQLRKEGRIAGEIKLMQRQKKAVENLDQTLKF